MIKSKPKQTAFRNKESIRCHWRKEVKASDLANCLGSFIRYTLGQCRRAKKAIERKMEGREKSLYASLQIPQSTHYPANFKMKNAKMSKSAV